MAQIKKPKHVAGSNNVKYTINPNNKHSLSCVRLSLLQFIRTPTLPSNLFINPYLANVENIVKS
jgi:accessory gene regulator protein AgrB